MQDGINMYFEAGSKGKFAKKVEWLQTEIALNERSSLSSPFSLIVKAAKEKNKLSITNGIGEPVCTLVSSLCYPKSWNEWKEYQ